MQVGARERAEVRRAGVVAASFSPCGVEKRVHVEAELARALVHQAHEAPARCRPLCCASATAASLPDTSSRPFRSASSCTFLPLRQHADRRPRRACGAPGDRARDRAGPRARRPASAVIIFVRLAIGSRRARVAAPQHAAGAHVEQQSRPRLALEAQLRRCRRADRSTRERESRSLAAPRAGVRASSGCAPARARMLPLRAAGAGCCRVADRRRVEQSASDDEASASAIPTSSTRPHAAPAPAPAAPAAAPAPSAPRSGPRAVGPQPATHRAAG